MTSSAYPFFRKYASLWALYNTPSNDQPSTDQDFESIWNMLTEILTSCMHKEENIKLLRWFSANASFRDNLPEFYCLKVILKAYYKGIDANDDDDVWTDPARCANKDPRKELAALKALQGLRVLNWGWSHRALCSDMAPKGKFTYSLHPGL